MLHTESICYVERGGRLTPVLNYEGDPLRWFISAPDIDRIISLLLQEISLPEPMLFVTRQTPAPATNFEI